MRHLYPASESERGAVLVHVALAIIGLTAFTTFVVDYGVLWASRRQAQNAADGAALSGAVALAFDDPTNTTSTGPAYLSAQTVVNASRVWGEIPVADITISAAACPAEHAGGLCVKVDVFRNQARGNPLPTFFGGLVGLTDQGIRATATAKVVIASATDCLKPWGVIDKWDEIHPTPKPWAETDFYDKYIQQGPNRGDPDPTINPPDNYVPPTPSDPGTGFRPYDANHNYTADYGRQLHLTMGDQNDFHYASGWFAPLALFDSKGGNDYSNNIKGCVGVTYKVGDEIIVDTEPGLMVGPTRAAVETDIDSIIARDPNAEWDPTANGGYGGVINSAYPVSPRIVAVPLVDPDEMTELQKGGRTMVSIKNIMGFFVEDYDNGQKSVIGRLMTIPGLMVAGTTPPIGGQSAFMSAIILIR